MANDKTPIEDILALLNDPEHVFTTKVTPIDSMIQFMVRTGNFKNKPTGGGGAPLPGSAAVAGARTRHVAMGTCGAADLGKRPRTRGSSMISKPVAKIVNPAD